MANFLEKVKVKIRKESVSTCIKIYSHFLLEWLTKPMEGIRPGGHNFDLYLTQVATFLVTYSCFFKGSLFIRTLH